MQDGKALQSGTSHYLGQNFARAFDVTFQNKQGQRELVYATSWGVSTRLIGALIMTHSDDTGLVLPPKLASTQVVIVPDLQERRREGATSTPKPTRSRRELKAQGLGVQVDRREGLAPGAKYYDWELRGVPLRIEIGPKDLEKGSLCLARRFVLESPGEDEKAARARKKSFLPRAEALAKSQAAPRPRCSSELFRARLALAREAHARDQLAGRVREVLQGRRRRLRLGALGRLAPKMKTRWPRSTRPASATSRSAGQAPARRRRPRASASSRASPARSAW